MSAERLAEQLAAAEAEIVRLRRIEEAVRLVSKARVKSAEAAVARLTEQFEAAEAKMAELRAALTYDGTTCNGEGHSECWGAVASVGRDSQEIVGVTLFPRGTPSCIWNVAVLYGPGSAKRRQALSALTLEADR